MSEDVGTISVEVVAPAMPLVLADTAFLSALAQVEKQVVDLNISDAQSSQYAADLQQRLTNAGSKLEETRRALKIPFEQILKKIDATAATPKSKIEALKQRLSSAQIAWNKKEKDRLDLEEKRRRDEIARLEQLRQAEIAYTARIAKELADKAAADAAANKPAYEVMDLDDGLPEFEDWIQPEEPSLPPQKTEIQKQLDAARFAPAKAAARPMGVRFTKSLTPVIVDINQVPDMFVQKTAKLQAIITTFCSGWREGEPLPVCAGVRFDQKDSVASTGRGSI